MDDMLTDDDAYYSARDEDDPTVDDVDYPAMDYMDYPAVDDAHDADYPAVVDVDYPAVVDDNRTMSLRQFCRRAKDLLSLDQTGFVSFVLTGRDTDGSQVCIDPVLNRVSETYPLHINRDYDSLLGFCDDILIKTNLTVYPVSKLDDTLSRNIHLRYDFNTANVSCLVVCQTGVTHGISREASTSTKYPTFALESGASTTWSVLSSLDFTTRIPGLRFSPKKIRQHSMSRVCSQP